MVLSKQAVTLDTDTPDRDGLLVFRDGRLIAVLSRLGDIHGPLEGHWYIESMFGDVPAFQPPTFETFRQFEDWLAEVP